MTAPEFQTLAISWIGTALVVGTALVAAYAKLKARIDDLNAKHEHNADVLQCHENRIAMIDDPCGRPANVAFDPPAQLAQYGLQFETGSGSGLPSVAEFNQAVAKKQPPLVNGLRTDTLPNPADFAKPNL